MQLKLYHSPLACSLASRLALVEAGLDHELVVVRTTRGEHQTPAYLAVNPLGRVPALEVDGALITESTAILPLVASLAPEAGLMPQEGIARAQAQALLGYMSSTLHAAWTGVLRPERFTRAADVEPARDAALLRLCDALTYLEGRLSGQDHLLERRSVCDLYLSVFLLWRSVPVVAGRLPATPWLDALQARVLAHPGLAAALQDDLALRQKG